MSDKSAIEWTDATWNPTTGCTKVSEGCRHCYIDRTPPFRINGISFRKDDEKSDEIGATTGLVLHPDRLDQPMRWKRPRRIFVNSLSDLFHDDIPDVFIADVFVRMACASQHVFQVLTKRPRRMAALLASPDFVDSVQRALDIGVIPYQGDTEGRVSWPLPNVWVGTSVEDQKRADLRIPLLLETPAAVRFLSCEPLLGPVELTGGWHDYLGADGGPAWKVEPDHAPGCNCMEAQWTGEPTTCPVPVQAQTSRVDWVIVGGESGPQARPMHPAWAQDLRDQCVAAAVPFFFKQWGEWAAGFGPERDYSKCMFVCNDGAVVGLRTADVYGADAFEHPMHVMRKIGKKHAGRELDGRTWDEMPQAVSA